MGDRNADRSSIEIKNLLRKLHPDKGNHKDRVRRLTKFRNYVMGDGKGKTTPEFYDDDIPLFFLGSKAPASYLDEEEYDAEALSGLYGLLEACGTPSGDHDGTLKRSARHAMNLLKWLLMDWKEKASGQKKSADQLNLFAEQFLRFEARYYHHMGLDLHVAGDDRGGAKEDACQVVVLILTKHLSEDGEKPQPVTLEELMSNPKAQQEFEIWSARHLGRSVQDAIKKNADARQAELAQQQRQAATGGKPGRDEYDAEDSDNENDHHHADHDVDSDDDDDDEIDDAFDDDDVVAAFRKRQKAMRRTLKEAEGRGEITASHGVAVRWEDSQLAREQRARAASLARAAAAGGPQAQHETVRDSQEAAAELAEREEEKARVVSKDPLGIIGGDGHGADSDDGGGKRSRSRGGRGGNKDDGDFDLRQIENSQAEQMEQALHEFQEQLQKVGEVAGGVAGGDHDLLAKKVAAQKESLEALVEGMGGIDTMENRLNRRNSVLPTDPKFDPMLFLTLVHRHAKFDELTGSLDRLSSKTENQVEQLQNLVRENFPLFVRCAEGFEAFRQSSASEVGVTVNERIDKLEGIAESCTYQAKKSFKPLLDNTSEVRKVQSAMTVLQRVAPILQVPASMRQHIENKRYSQALKTYRRVLVVDDRCKIELLLTVKRLAEQCVREARRDLEWRMARDCAAAPAVADLLDCIRDLSELLELDVPMPPQQQQQQQQQPQSKSKEDEGDEEEAARKRQEEGIYHIGGTVIKVREHPPALACLLLQAAHFSYAVKSMIKECDTTCQRIFLGESLQDVQTTTAAATGDGKDLRMSSGGSVASESPSEARSVSAGSTAPTIASAGNQWKYDVLDARVLSTIKAVNTAALWLPRLVRVGKAAKEDEKRRAARIGLGRRRSGGGGSGGGSGDPASSSSPASLTSGYLTAFEVFLTNITPSMTRLVEHAAFCGLGSNTRSGAKEVVLTFGQTAPDKLRALLKSPLPPTQSTKVGKELASLVEVISQSWEGANALRSDHAAVGAGAGTIEAGGAGASASGGLGSSSSSNAKLQLEPLHQCKLLADSAVISIEKRRCLYAFDVCARACSNRASGSGKLDADSLLHCLRTLSEQLSRPDQCAQEVEKGCELVIRRCCEGLASYVRDRGDPARLSAVSECADVMSDRLEEVVREASFITNNADGVGEIMSEDIMGLEGAMFDEYLDSIRIGVANSVRLEWLDTSAAAGGGGKSSQSSSEQATVAATTDRDGSAVPPSFPPYLSASLLAIVRCRAQVEQALGDRMRRSEGVSYQYLSMATVADSVVQRVCGEIKQRFIRLKVRQADRLANELEFLRNTLKRFLSPASQQQLTSTLTMVSTKAGRGRDYQGDGPDGLAALEELERLGRVYVLCLGE